MSITFLLIMYRRKKGRKKNMKESSKTSEDEG
jgi:hypothetical protein